MTEVRVVATIPATADAADSIRSALTVPAEQSRQQEGCLDYGLFESAAAAHTFVTIERWRSQSDLDEHMRSPQVTAAFAAAEGSLAGEVAIHPLAPVA